MRVFVPFAVRGIGGTTSFVAKFKEGMEARGHTVCLEQPKEYDVLLLIVQAPLSVLMDAKRRGIPIVQRLDGVYYWTVAGLKFPLMNAKAFLARHLFADFTIYQSAYSRRSVEQFLGVKLHERSETICNGVDLMRFSPDGERKTLRDRPGQRIFLTASAFRRADQILPLVAAMISYRQKVYEDTKLVIAGTFAGPVALIPQRYAHLPFIQFVGKVGNEELPHYHRAADVFVLSHLNPPCPNNVIEALASGLPVTGLADGAMPELVRSGITGTLLPVQGSGYWRRRTFNPDEFAHTMASTWDHRQYLGSAARTYAVEHFGLPDMIHRYETVLEAVQRR